MICGLRGKESFRACICAFSQLGRSWRCKYHDAAFAQRSANVLCENHSIVAHSFPVAAGRKQAFLILQSFPGPDKLNNTEQHLDFAELVWKNRPLRLEYQWVGAASSSYPVVVFLHEGLGSISMWRDFPQRFCEQHGLRGLVFSRYGYGRSTPRPLEESLPTSYLHEQALDALPLLLAHLHIDKPWLFGHSDGGSIALLYAARFPEAVSGIIVMAPHIFVEDITIAGIRKAREAFAATDLRARLARHHTDAESVFRGWNDAWLDPAFRLWNIEDELPQISCPVLALQGEDDEYGTLEQIHGIARKAQHARAVALPDCGHSPHRDQPEEVSRLAGEFIKQAG